MKHSNSILCCSLFLASLLAAGNAGAQACVEPPIGLVSWWPGDGNTDDLQSNRAAELGGDAGYAQGVVGDAFALSGADTGLEDRVILPAEVVDGLGDLTVELWINTVHPGQAAILSGANGVTGGDNEMLLFQMTNPTDLFLGMQGMSSGRVPVVINDGVWHHLAFTRQGGEARIYVDGGMAAAHPVPNTPIFVEPGGLLIGQEQDCLGGCFSVTQALTGLVDEVSIYAKALSDDEIWSIANAGAAGKCKPVQPLVANEELVVRIEQLEHHMGVLIDRVTELESQAADEQCDSPGQLWEYFLGQLHDRKDQYKQQDRKDRHKHHDRNKRHKRD